MLPLRLKLIFTPRVNMLSLLFDCLNPVFSHICLHKTLTIIISVHIPFIFTQFITKRERNLKHLSLHHSPPPPPALTDLTTDVSGLDHREKIGFADTLSLAFRDNKRQRYIRDGKKCFVLSVSGPNNAISRAEQKRSLLLLC